MELKEARLTEQSKNGVQPQGKIAKKFEEMGCCLGCLTIFGGIFVVAVILSIIITFLLPDENNQPVDKHEAIVQAETYVKDILKSPKSAKFSGITETNATEISTDEWEVTGWVDAENSFGADVRSNYRVVMEVDAKEREWTRKDIEIQ